MGPGWLLCVNVGTSAVIMPHPVLTQRKAESTGVPVRGEISVFSSQFCYGPNNSLKNTLSSQKRTDTCYNMDELQTIMFNPTQKVTHNMISFTWNVQTGKSTKTENRGYLGI